MFLDSDLKEECAGCLACFNICEFDAIELFVDSEGFTYPKINALKCVGCDKCRKVCGFDKGVEVTGKKAVSIFGAVHNDETVRMSSRSGGAFTALSDVVLENEGVVYGATLDEYGRVFHRSAESKDMRDSFKGSKYVQSDISEIYSSLKTHLNENRMVMLSGTPCQVDGISRWLKHQKIDTKNLVKVDFICHGVPSPMVWREYYTYLIKKHNGISDFNFRDKEEKGWKAHHESFVTSKGKRVVRDYSHLFYNNDIFRPACYNCNYANFFRVSDITIADFWGIEKLESDFDDDKGVSLLLINSEKGMNFFRDARKQMKVVHCETDVYMQKNLKEPLDRPQNRANFWSEFEKHGIEGVIYRNKVRRVIKKIEKLLPKTGR